MYEALVEVEIKICLVSIDLPLADELDSLF